MNVTVQAPADLDDLRKRVASEGHAKRRDRFRVVLEALRGQETLDIARLVGRSRKFVQHRVYQYRDHGLAGLEGKSAEVMGKYFFDAFPEARGSIFDQTYHQAVKEKIALKFATHLDTAPCEGWYSVHVYPQAEGISVIFQPRDERPPVPGSEGTIREP